MKESLSISRVFEKQSLKMPRRVLIFDTTLRDGEQPPGICYTLEEKLKIADQLDKLGVDVIEAGFPSNSPHELKAVEQIAKSGLKAKICGLARCHKGDINACLRAGVDRAHVFIATSDIHLRYKLKMSREKALSKAVESIEYCKAHGVECEFSCEDATRTDLRYLLEFYGMAEEAGADIVNVPDTVGAMDPDSFFKLISKVAEMVRIPVSVHCHNDFGLATANTIMGVKGGASQVHVTVNGLGERAGNASLEQVVTALKLFYGVETGVNLKLLTETSRLIQKYSMIPVPPNYPVVGVNAFAHEAGIHVHGVMERAECYEPYPPELVGQERRIVLGKHTGKHAVSSFVKAYFGEVPDEKVAIIVDRIKELSSRKKKITEDDVLAISEEVLRRPSDEEKKIELTEMVVVTGNKVSPTAFVHLKIGDELRVAASAGVGPVDAAAHAIQKALREEVRLLNYKLEAISGGTDALASVEVLVDDLGGIKARGTAISGDIVMSSVQALIDSLNKLYLRRARK